MAGVARPVPLQTGSRAGITARTGVWALPGRARAHLYSSPPCPALAPGPPGYLQRGAQSEGMA